MNLKLLSNPFPAEDVEWRIQRSGKTGKGAIYAMVLCYVTNRAIMQRLDDVCGPEHWRNEYQPGPGGGVICGISILCEHGWVTKWDGADNTQVESVKGGLSDAMKRAAVQWGIGRYLYRLDAFFAETATEKRPGWERARLSKNDGSDAFWWCPPQLPDWALPGKPAAVDSKAVRECIKAADDAENADQLRVLWTQAKAGGYLELVHEYLEQTAERIKTTEAA